MIFFLLFLKCLNEIVKSPFLNKEININIQEADSPTNRPNTATIGVRIKLLYFR